MSFNNKDLQNKILFYYTSSNNLEREINELLTQFNITGSAKTYEINKVEWTIVDIIGRVKYSASKTIKYKVIWGDVNGRKFVR